LHSYLFFIIVSLCDSYFEPGSCAALRYAPGPQDDAYGGGAVILKDNLHFDF
jgi:hypothetical protein